MTAALSASPPPPTGLSIWWMAARPRTLVLSAVPVAVGSAIAWAQGGMVHWAAALAALLGSVFIQIGTNLHNDASDFERGGDGPNRIGPARVTAGGLLSAAQVKRGAWTCFAISALAGLFLVYVGGWPILALGLASILCGWAYSGGPLPICYTPLGEVFVLLFFGLGAVEGTAWLHLGSFSGTAAVGGIAVGLFASGVSLVNNFRDVENDASVGRRTLALVAGPKLTYLIFGAFLLVPFALIPILQAHLPERPVWLAYFALPLALRMVWRFVHEPRGQGFNLLLGKTAQVQLAFGLLLCLGLVW